MKNNEFTIDAFLVTDEYFDCELSHDQDDLLNINYYSIPTNELTICQLYSTAQLGNLDITIDEFDNCIFDDFQ